MQKPKPQKQPLKPKIRKARKRKKHQQKSQRRKYINFEETAIGRFLLIFAPIEYNLLLEYSVSDKYCPISYQTIETIAYNSNNPAFKSVRFRKAMVDYRLFGLNKRNKVKWTISDAVYYAKNTYYIVELLKQCTE